VVDDISAEAVETARLFHETYERLAPDFGYRTREASAKPWDEVPEQNRALMIATCAEVGARIRARVLAEVAEPEPCPLDHSCDEDEPCGCWCHLHDCAIAECPTLQRVNDWLKSARADEHSQIESMLRTEAMRMAESSHVFAYEWSEALNCAADYIRRKARD